MSIEREGEKGSSRIDHLPRTHETLRALGAYVEARQDELGARLRQRAVLQIHLEAALQRFRALQVAKTDDEEIEKLEARLRSLRGEPERAHFADADDAAKLSEAQAACDLLKAQIADLDASVQEQDAKLLARFGLG